MSRESTLLFSRQIDLSVHGDFHEDFHVIEPWGVSDLMSFAHHVSSRSSRHRVGRLAVTVSTLAMACVFLATAASAQIAQEYFVPIRDDQVRDWAASINTNFLGDGSGTNPDTVRSVISIAAIQAGTTIVWDHWEDGLEPDLENVAGFQSTTSFIGDGDISNGGPPGCAADACDVIAADTFLVFENDVPANPLAPAACVDRPSCLFDGGDRIGTSQIVAITRAGWRLQEDTLLAGAVEVFPSYTWGRSFEIPAGVDNNTGCDAFADDETGTLTDFSTICAFSYVAASITAGVDGASVNIDVDGDGTDDIFEVLGAGESTIATNLFSGAEITSTDDVEVHILTGDVGSNYEARWFNLVPTTQWSDTYYTPVATTVAAVPTAVLLYNPDDSAAITVTAETWDFATGTNSASVVVPAGGVNEFIMPSPSGTDLTGARFSTAGGEPFFAISVSDYEDTASDWGMTLLPEPLLTTSAVAGWAPGRNVASGTNPAENGSPIWVVAESATTLQIDYDGDGVVDTTQGVEALEAFRIFDPNDTDQNGLIVSTNDGTLITAAWGQDPENASGAAPAIDVGTTVVPIPLLDIVKTAELVVDLNNDSTVDAGDTIEYTIRVESIGTTTALQVILEDPLLDANTTYVADSTERDGLPIADDTVNTTLFPLDEGGINLGDLPTTAVTLITFRVTVNDPLPPGTIELLNSAIVTSPDGGGTSTVTVPVLDPGLVLTKASSPTADVLPGEQIDYTMTLTNNGATNQSGIRILDALPARTLYVADSTSVTGFQLTLFQVVDRFDTESYANDDGPDNFAANWTEVDDNGGGATGGNVEVTGGAMNLSSPGAGTLESVQRSAGNLSAFTEGSMSMTLRLGFGLDATDAFVVEIAPDGTTFTVLETISGFTGAQGFFRNYDITPYLGTNVTARVRITANYGGGDEFIEVDNFQIRAQASTLTTRDNIPAGTNGDLVDGVPENLVLAPDNFGLAPTQSMTVSFSVTVEDPLDPFESAIVNHRASDHDRQPFPAVRHGRRSGDRGRHDW